jgi:hypothetical protein
MDRLISKVPWFVSAAAAVGIAAVMAVASSFLLGPYFERSFLDEASPLTSAEGMGEGPTAATTGNAGATPSPPATDPTAAAPGAGVLRQGEWRDGEPGHNGEGVAKIIRTAEGKLVLRVEMFSVTNGPDLFVVLSPDDDGYADGSLNLGGLKATDGNFNYEIPDGTDLSQYRSAVVWCRGADITFAYAPLEDV